MHAKTLAGIQARAELVRRIMAAIRNEPGGLATVRALLNFRLSRPEAPKAEKLSGTENE